MRIELPSQSEIIEELVDRVAAQIDLGKPVAFDNALAELRRYHRFVLGLSASTTPDGDPFNYAEIAGISWRAPHEQWLGQYRRLFEKAAERIPDNVHFIAELAHGLGGLLTLPEGLVASKAVTDAALNLFPVLVGSAERWVTKRAAHREGESDKVLPGSDVLAYGEALRELVGAWEGLFHASPAIMQLDQRQGLTNAQRWKTFNQAWQFLWRHLVDTCYCIGIAVWNDDAAGAATFSEALARWPENFRFMLANPLYLQFPDLLFPGLIELDWNEAQAKAATLAFGHQPEIDAGELFATIVSQVHADVVQIAASVFAYWTVNEKRPGTLAIRTARSLLSGDGAERYDQPSPPLNVGTLLPRFLRFQLAGERYEDGSYGAKLTGIASRLDNLTGPSMVPGRIYSSHTLNDRKETIWGDTALLAAFVDGTDIASLEQNVRELTEAEVVLPRHDRSLRDLQDELGRYLEVREANPPQVLDVIAKLGSDTPEADLDRLGALIERLRAIIVEHRAEQLRVRPIDPKKLEMRQSAIESALMDPRYLSLFQGVAIKIDGDGTGELCTYSSRTPKARLTDPMMDVEIGNELEFLAEGVARWVDRRANAALFSCPVEEVAANTDPLDGVFWDRIRDLKDKVGGTPRLLLPHRFRVPLTHLIFQPMGTILEGRTPNREQGQRNDYIGTIDGIRVHNRSTDDRTAWLFSGEKLEAVRYDALENGHIVSVDYEPAEGDEAAVQGELKIRFQQRFDWKDTPVFCVALPPEVDATIQTSAKPEAIHAPLPRAPRRPRSR
jgi:hypothetical protein